MKCYVANGNLKMVINAESRKDALTKTVCIWLDRYGEKVITNRTRVSEIGFDFEQHDHKDDSIFATSVKTDDPSL